MYMSLLVNIIDYHCSCTPRIETNTIILCKFDQNTTKRSPLYRLLTFTFAVTLIWKDTMHLLIADRLVCQIIGITSFYDTIFTVYKPIAYKTIEGVRVNSYFKVWV